jgi:molybdate transport system substrate-binding protein
MRTLAAIAIAAGLSILSFFGAGAAAAVEIKVLVSNALKSSMEELAPQFEKATQNKLAITFGAAAELKTSIEKGAAIDLAILTAEVTDALIKEGKLTAAGRADIARSGAGVAARKGAPKPDISTTEAFKHALLDAKSIAYVEAGATAPYIKSLFERLGIADQIKPKEKLKHGGYVADLISSGQSELGIHQISEIVPAPGVTLVGPLPKEIQNYTVYAAGVGPNTKYPDEAKKLIATFTSPSAQALFKSRGMEPGGP